MRRHPDDAEAQDEPPLLEETLLRVRCEACGTVFEIPDTDARPRHRGASTSRRSSSRCGSGRRARRQAARAPMPSVNAATMTSTGTRRMPHGV